jgi:hypothetical protein
MSLARFSQPPLFFALLVLCASALLLAQTGEDLFRQAREKEVVDGDIPAAILLYERVVREFPSNRALVAQSLLQLGECYERLNQPAKSREAFRRIVAQFKDQAESYARAGDRLNADADGRKRVEIKTPYTEDPLAFAISPDGRSVVYEATVNGKRQLWLHSLDTGKASPIAGTENSAEDLGGSEGGARPFWSPNGQSIGFFADRKLKIVAASGGIAKILADAPTPRGGSWNEISGRYEIYVQAFPGSPAKRQRVSIAGGKAPAWRADGNELYFLSLDTRLMSVTVTVTPDRGFETGRPVVFSSPLPDGASFEPDHDGQRFLINSPAQDLSPILVLSNWEAK